MGPLGITQHAAIHSEFLPVAHSFVGEEKECTVLPDGAAKGGAELVASERRLGLIEEVAGVKRIIAEELEHLAMKLIAARARGDVDDRARVAPVFGAEGRVINLEFPNGIDRRL